MELTLRDIHDLIEIGIDKVPKENLYNSFKSRDFINRQHGNTWKKLISEKSDIELVSIYKALILIEKELKWIGGSVAGAIWVYKIIQERNLDLDYELADFGLRNCKNPWIPFGGSYYGKRTISEYLRYNKEKSKKKAEKSQEYNIKLNREKGRKFKRANAIAELRKLTKEERENIKIELHANYKAKTPLERLELIANNEKYPPEYYPTEWANVPAGEIQQLPLKLVQKLFDKLSIKTRGSWKRFAQELKSIENGK
jgi:hypothetical protein